MPAACSILGAPAARVCCFSLENGKLYMKLVRNLLVSAFSIGACLSAGAQNSYHIADGNIYSPIIVPRQTSMDTQWVTFDFKSSNYFSASPIPNDERDIGRHFVMGTRYTPADTVNKNPRFKGIFFARRPDYEIDYYPDPKDLEHARRNEYQSCETNQKVYLELSYSQPEFDTSNPGPGYPSAHHVACAWKFTQDKVKFTPQDNVEYSIMIQSTVGTDGMSGATSYWIYQKNNCQLLSQGSIADQSYPQSWQSNGRTTPAQTVSIPDVIRNTAGAKSLAEQKNALRIGFAAINGVPTGSSIDIKNIQTGWINPNGNYLTYLPRPC
jgi:hypothetical protein